MQTIRFVPQAKQLRKARESLDVFVPVSEQLRLHTITSELDAPSVKEALRGAQAPLVLVVSAQLDGSVHPVEIGQAFPPVSVQVAGNQHEGLVSVLRPPRSA
jgi:hypothetical protein